MSDVLCVLINKLVIQNYSKTRRYRKFIFNVRLFNDAVHEFIQIRSSEIIIHGLPPIGMENNDCDDVRIP